MEYSHLERRLDRKTPSEHYEGRFDAMAMDYQERVRRGGEDYQENYDVCNQILPIMGEVLDSLKKDRVQSLELFERDMLLQFASRLKNGENDGSISLGVKFLRQNYASILTKHQDFLRDFPVMIDFLEVAELEREKV